MPSPQQLSEQLVRDHLPLVGYAVSELAGRLPRHIRRDDLVSAGMLGLAQAAAAFDEERGVTFGTFARARIRGAMLDELRQGDWATRSVRSQARRADAAADTLTAELGRAPDDVELAARLQVDADQIRQLRRDVDQSMVLSYESVVLGTDGDAAVPAGDDDPETQMLARERCGYLNDAVDALPEPLRTVIVGSFYEDRLLQDIAADLGVTPARVSQLRSEALQMLGEALRLHLEDSPAPTQPTRGATAKRKAAYYAAVASASDYRGRFDAPGEDVAARIAATGLG